MNSYTAFDIAADNCTVISMGCGLLIFSLKFAAFCIHLYLSNVCIKSACAQKPLPGSGV